MRRALGAAVTLLVVAVACGGRSALASPTLSPEPVPTSQASVLAVSPSPSSPSPTVLPFPSAATRPARELVFVELTTGRRFSIQADPSARDLGHFAYSVPDLGAYSGFAEKGLKVSSTEILLDHTGPATFFAFATGSPGTTPNPPGPTTVTVRLQARLDPVSRTGTVTLTRGTEVIGLTASIPSVADLDPVVLAFERAMVSGDASALYGVMNSDLTSAYTPATFAQHLASEEARVGKIGALRRLSMGPPLFGDFGFWLVVVAYEAERIQPTGARSVAKYDAYFVRERSGWKLLSTTER